MLHCGVSIDVRYRDYLKVTLFFGFQQGNYRPRVVVTLNTVRLLAEAEGRLTSVPTSVTIDDYFHFVKTSSQKY